MWFSTKQPTASSRLKPVSLNQLINGLLATFIVGWASCVLAQPATDSGPIVEEASPWHLQLEHLQQQLSIGEIAPTAKELEDLIGTIQAEYGSYHRYLIDPLVLLGDARMGAEQPTQAVEVYQQALQIQRTTTGPTSIAQQPIVRKIGWAYAMQGNHQNATRMFEKAYEYSLNHYGVQNPRLIPDSVMLLEWYEQHDKHFQAAVLSTDILKMTSRMWSADDSRLLELKRTFARAMKDATFPPQREFGLPNFRAQLPGMDWQDIRRMPSFYSMGISVLKDVVNSLEPAKNEDPILYATTLLELADFYQAARRVAWSMPLYREAWQVLEEAPNLRDRTFADPKLLFIALPVVPEPDTANYSLGHVELALTVSNHGRVVGRKTVSVRPRNDQLEHIVRVAARGARYRPAFVSSEPVRSRDVVFTHYYPMRGR